MPDFDGKGSRKTGRGGGPGGEGAGGFCICPACGYKEGHVRGEPCNTKKCPKCGASMIRE
jgi:hypothetical protein